LKKHSVEQLKKQFGIRLRSYRMAIGLPLNYFAEMHHTTPSYLSRIESGRHNPSLETMQQYADTFGIAFYELANPDFPIPPLSSMPLPTRRAVERFRKEQQQKEAEREHLKETGSGVYATGLARTLRSLLEEGFFRTPRTSKKVFLKLHPDADPDALTPEQHEAIGRITGTLVRGRFPKLLNKLEPLPGKRAMRFVEKEG